jgi:hypothetical protein
MTQAPPAHTQLCTSVMLCSVSTIINHTLLCALASFSIIRRVRSACQPQPRAQVMYCAVPSIKTSHFSHTTHGRFMSTIRGCMIVDYSRRVWPAVISSATAFRMRRRSRILSSGTAPEQHSILRTFICSTLRMNPARPKDSVCWRPNLPIELRLSFPSKFCFFASTGAGRMT